MTRNQDESERIEFDRRTVLKGIGTASVVGSVGAGGIADRARASHTTTGGGLVAYYPLDELDGSTVEDAVHNNDGTNNGATVTTGDGGQFDEAFDFDGTDDQVTVDPFTDLSGGSVTVAAWVFPQSTPNRFSNVLSLADQTGSNRTNSVLIQHRGEDTGDPFLFGVDDGTGSVTSITSGGIGTGNWHHVALTQDGSNLRAYLDGSEISTSPVSVSDHISIATNVVRLAQNAIGNSVTLYDVKIDDVRIFNRALAADEINSLADNTQTLTVTDSDSIQDAIDVANPGDTIVVESGTYDEDVTAHIKNLTIEGPNAGICGDSDDRGPEATIEGQVVLTADGTTLDGFDVSPPPATGNPDGEAVRISNTPDDVTVQNNVVRDFEAADNFSSTNFEGIEGIVVFGPDGSDTIEDPTISCNQVKNINSEDADGGAAGIMVQGNVDGAVVEDNNVFDIGEEKSPWAQAVVINSTGDPPQVPTNVDVTGNELSSIRADPNSETHGVGVGVETDGTGYLVSENEMEGNNIGVEVKAAADDTEISENEIKETTAPHFRRHGGVGIFVGDDSTTVNENEVKNSEDDGIRVDGDSNTIEGNEVKESGADGIHLLGDTSGNTVEGNEMKESDDFDAHDGTSNDAATVANTWKNNECEDSSPTGLCDEE